MNELTRSALLRAARTALQLVVAVLALGMTKGFAQAMGAHWNLPPEATGALVVAVTALNSFLHRRFLDPSQVWSLTDQAT